MIRKMIENPLQGRTLFTLFGIPWKLTKASRQFVPSRLAAGLIIAFIFMRTEPLGIRLTYGLAYGLILLLSQFLHIIGHTLGGKLVGHPMSANLIVAYQFTTYYADEPPLPRRVHLTRTIGGPLINFIIAGLAFFAWQAFGEHTLLFTTIINLFLTALLFLPFKGIDGEIFWREIRRSTTQGA